MSYNSTSLNQKGEAMCISCRKKFFTSNLQNCAMCEKYVCKQCASYRKQGNPFGYVCKSCLSR